MTSVNNLLRFVAAKCIALGSQTVHSTRWSQILAESRLTHLHSTSQLRGPRRNITVMFVIEKLEWCGYPTVKIFWRYLYSFRQSTQTWRTDGRQTPHDGIRRSYPRHREAKQELSYRKQIARQLRTQFVEGISVTLKSTLRVTQGHWKRNHWTDHIYTTSC